MRLFEKGQGATEYLLMLAAVLVIVAIAVYYVTSAPGAPTIVASVQLSAGTVTLRGETGCTEITDWSFSYKGGTVTAWQTGSATIGPGDTITLTGLAGAVSVGNTVTIKYDTTTKSAVISAENTWVGLA